MTGGRQDGEAEMERKAIDATKVEAVGPRDAKGFEIQKEEELQDDHAQV